MIGGEATQDLDLAITQISELGEMICTENCKGGNYSDERGHCKNCRYISEIRQGLRALRSRPQPPAASARFKVTIGDHHAEIVVDQKAPPEYHQGMVQTAIAEVLRRASGRTVGPAIPDPPLIGAGVRDVLAERDRQKNQEGWTEAHDDAHAPGELALAASCYAARAFTPTAWVPTLWPWDKGWWKPKDPRRNLVRAAALILAEIESCDRTHAWPEAAPPPEARVHYKCPTCGYPALRYAGKPFVCPTADCNYSEAGGEGTGKDLDGSPKGLTGADAPSEGE